MLLSDKSSWVAEFLPILGMGTPFFYRTGPIFLTFPTGWHYHAEFKQLRKASFDTIKSAIFAIANGLDRNEK
jgi:hypothetical protein